MVKDGGGWAPIKFHLFDTGVSRGDGPTKNSDEEQLATDHKWSVLDRETEFGLGSSDWIRSLRSCLVSI